MRWFLLTLLLINAVAYYWFSGHKAQRELRRVVEVPVRDKSAKGQLVLVSERQNVVPGDFGKGDDGDVSVQVASLPGTCVVIGPITQDGVVGRVSKGLEAAGISSEDWQVNEEVVSGYWVYLPPRESRAVAQNHLNTLREKGIDSFVFEEGGLANGISLGIYSSSINAERRRDEIFRRGYRPEIRVATSVVRGMWLQFDAGKRSELSKKFWSDIQSMAPDAKISEKSCEAVASASDLP